MAQSNTVMAFRKRMKKRGYEDIHIYSIKDRPQIFIVTAIDPACKCKVSAEVDFRSMCFRCK